jgi:hypothetical protein
MTPSLPGAGESENGSPAVLFVAVSFDTGSNPFIFLHVFYL